MKLILAAIDFQPGTRDVLSVAGELARATGARLILLHAATPDCELVDDSERTDVSRRGLATQLRRRHRELRVLEIEMRKLGVDALSILCRSDSPRGNPAPKIIESVARHAPDLVVLGSHAHGRLHHLLGGSVTDAVVRKTNRPVLLVPVGAPQAAPV